MKSNVGVKNGTGIKYTVPQYLNMLERANRSNKTIIGYQKIFQMYAKHLGITVSEVHNYISVGNLLEFADSRKGMSPAGTKTALSVLRRYATLNGVVFDELEFNAMKPKVAKENNDKPLTLPMLQAMMDLTDVHGRSMLSFLVSTGLRAGEFSQLLLSDIGRLDGDRFVSDINGDVINVRPGIAKSGHGGCVYLTAEAREYLTLWMKERDKYIADIDKKSLNLVNHGAHRRPDNDQRIFGTGYSALRDWFTRLFAKVDGEKGKYQNACTLHSCRKYFRTVAAQSMHPDLVTNLMRQTGYLDNTYVRTPVSEKYRQFKEKEAALYITRADHRIQGSKLDALKKENAVLLERLKEVERKQTMIQTFEDEEYTQEEIQRARAILKTMLKDKA